MIALEAILFALIVFGVFLGYDLRAIRDLQQETQFLQISWLNLSSPNQSVPLLL